MFYNVLELFTFQERVAMHECIDAAFWNRSLPSAFVSGKNKDDIYYHEKRGRNQEIRRGLA